MKRVYNMKRGYGTVVRVISSEEQHSRRENGPAYVVQWDDGGRSTVKARKCAVVK